MRLLLRKPAQALGASSIGQFVRQGAFDTYRQALVRLVSKVNEDESEDHQLQIITTFLGDVLLSSTLRIEPLTNGVRQVYEIQEEGSSKSTLLVAKRAYGAEMMTALKPNVKALHELVLAFLDLKHQQPDADIAHLIATDGYNWFWFNATEFREVFIDNPRIQRIYQLKKQGRSDAFFFAEVAKIFRELQANVPVTYLNLREIADLITTQTKQIDDVLIPVYLLFTDSYFFAKEVGNHSELDSRFKEELAYILDKIPAQSYCWFSRLLFLRLLESQREAIGVNATFRLETIHTLDGLLLVLKEAARIHPTFMESAVNDLSGEDNDVHFPTVPLFDASIFTAEVGNDVAQSLPVLIYLTKFMATCEFLLDGQPKILPDDKLVIDSDGLDQCLAWLSEDEVADWAIIRYAVKTTLRTVILNLFNGNFGWSCRDVNALKEKLSTITLVAANQVINQLRLVDPTMGSGRFLQAALQEILVIKAELGILMDDTGQPLAQYILSTDCVRLTISQLAGEPFYYQASELSGRPTEMQRVQSAIYAEKEQLIKSSLFGVAHDSGILDLAQLRLWIELIRSSYVTVEKKKAVKFASKTQLQRLPGLSTTLRVGNALVYRIGLDLPLIYEAEELRERLLAYETTLAQYQKKNDLASKVSLNEQIDEFRQHFINQIASNDRPIVDRLTRLQALFTQRYESSQLFNEKLSAEQLKHQTRLQQDINRLLNKLAERNAAIYEQGIEWRVIWPLLWNEQGNFVGFDAVISQPSTRIAAEQAMVSYLKQRYPAVYASKAPIYAYVMQLAIDLLKPNGQALFVVPTQWQQAGSTRKLRQWLLANKLEKIVNWQTSQQATVVLTKAAPAETYLVAHAESNQSEPTTWTEENSAAL